jgi:hypothetical protein
MVGEAVTGNQIEALAKARVHGRLAAGDRHVMVAERLGFDEDLVEHLERQKKIVIVLSPSPVDAPKTMGAVEIADVVKFNSNSWHI